VYAFPRLPVGRYELTLQIDGFKAQKRTGIQVDADSALQMNATLELGEQSETSRFSVNTYASTPSRRNSATSSRRRR